MSREELVESLGTVLTSRLDLDKSLNFQDSIGKQVLENASGAYEFLEDNDIPTIPIVLKEDDHFLEVGGMLSAVILRWEWQEQTEENQTPFLTVTIEAENAFVYFERKGAEDPAVAAALGGGTSEVYFPGMKYSSLSVSLFLKNVLVDFQAAEMQVIMSEMEVALAKAEDPWTPPPHVLKSAADDVPPTIEDYVQVQVSIHKVVMPALLEMNKVIMEWIVDRQTGIVNGLLVPTCEIYVKKDKESKAIFDSFLDLESSALWVDIFDTPHAKVETQSLFFLEAGAQSDKKPILSRPWIVKEYQGDATTHVGTILRHYSEVFVERTLKKEASEHLKTKLSDKLGGAVARGIVGATPVGLILSVGVVHVSEGARVLKKKVAKKRAERRGEVWEEPEETEEEKKQRQDQLKARTVSAAGSTVGAAAGMAVGVFAGPPGMIIGALVGGFLAEKAEQKRQKVRDALAEKRRTSAEGEDEGDDNAEEGGEEPEAPKKRWRPLQKLREKRKTKSNETDAKTVEEGKVEDNEIWV